MSSIEALRDSFPDEAKDIKINLQNVLMPANLSASQVYGVALSCAYALKSKPLIKALVADAGAAQVPETTLQDAKAAAIMMGMNNIYYRFRHAIGKESYSQKPARLRMMRLKQATSNQLDFELYSFAVSAVNFCEACMCSHEAVVLEGGMTEEQVHDAVRIAATVQAAAVALSTLE